jgi:endothelin-converting enzyme/putative endopeptidase
MNVSVDPCQDFFSYACGGWIAKNPILPSTSKWSPFGKLDMDTNKLLQGI